MQKLIISIGLCLTALLYLNTLSSQAQGGAEDLFKSKCGACHSIDIPLSEKHDEKGWQAIVNLMRSYGAKLTDKEAESIVNYLSKR